MYTIPVEVSKSKIDGQGVFTKTNIKNGSIVWQYTNGHDRKMSIKEFDNLDENTRTKLQRIAYLSPYTNLWVIPPEDDPACFTNHDPVTHNTSVVFDEKISDEPLFVANRNINAGEEITNNYLEFDNNSVTEKFKWLKS